MNGQKFLTIDIRNESTKILEVLKKKEKVEVLKVINQTNYNKYIEDGQIDRVEELIENIRQVIQEEKIKTNQVVFSIVSSKVITREIVIPYVSQKKLSKLLQMNASEYFPVNIDDYILDYIVLNTIQENGSKKLKLLIVAAPNGLVENYLILAKGLGLKIKAIDYIGNSVYQVLNKENNKGTNVYLHIDNDFILATIFDNQQLEIQRYFTFGKNELYEAVVEQFQVSEEEALNMMRDKSIFNYETDHNPFLGGDITSAINKILGGVSRFLEYYLSRSSKTIDKIYLLDSGHTVQGLEAYVAQFFNIKLEMIHDFQSVQSIKLERFEKEHMKYTLCLGAAFSPLKLIPTYVLTEQTKSTRKRIVAELTILASVLSLSTVMIPINEMNSLKREKEQLLLQVEAAKAFEQILEQHAILKDQMDFRMEMMSYSKNSSEELLEIINELEKTVPSMSYYVALSNTKEQLTLSGYAKDIITVAKFIEQIKGMPYFEHIYIPNINVVNNEASEEEVAFSATITHKERVLENEQ